MLFLAGEANISSELTHLKGVSQYQFLDTTPEAVFDDLALLAAQVSNTPIALISLIDAGRLWFKARVGLPLSETSQEFLLCIQALYQSDDIVMARDTWLDERFAASPLVISDPHLRFYAGIPLITDEGDILGTLCVIDYAPRELTTEQRAALRTVGRAVKTEIQLRHKRVEKTPERREQSFYALAENLPDIVARLDRRLRHLYINSRVEGATGYPPEAFIGKTNKELGMPEDLVRYWDQKICQVFETGEATTIEFTFPNNINHFECRIIPEHSLDGSVETVLAITQDVTKRKQAEVALRKQNRELALLNRAIQAFISTLELDRVLMHILEEACDLLEVNGSSIWLVDPKTQGLIGWQATLPEHNIISGWQLAPGQGIAGWVVEHRQSVIVADTRLEPRHFKGVDQQTGTEIRSILTAPLFSNREVMGVLQMVDARIDRFKEADLELVELLASTATIGIENASLFQALVEGEKRYRSLFENAAIPLWEEDLSAAKAYLEALRQTGVHDFAHYFQQHPEIVHYCTTLIQIVDVNRAGMEMHRLNQEDRLLGNLEQFITPITLPAFAAELVAVAEGQLQFARDAMPHELSGKKAYVDVSWSVVPGYEGTYKRVIVCLRDVTEQVQAGEALRRYAERLSVLHEIDQAILASQSAEAIAQTALGHIRRLVPCQRATVMVFDFEASEAIRLAVNIDGETRIGAGTRISLQDPWITDLWDHKVQIVEDISALLQPSPILQAVYREGINAFICVPLIVQDILIGSLNLGFNRSGPIAPESISIGIEVAASLAVAIQQARLWEAEQQAYQVAKTLHAASAALTQSLHLETVLETLLDYLVALVPYDTASVMLLETEARLARQAMRRYEDWTDPILIRQRDLNLESYPLLKTVLTTQASLIVPDTYEFPDWHVLAGSEYIRNWMGIPLLFGDTIIGLYSLNKAEPNFFTQKHLHLAETLAIQAAVAIQNARLFEQVEAGRQQLQTLSHRLVEVQEAERRHLARELHDEIGEILTGLKFTLEMCARLPAEIAGNKLSEAQQLVGQLMLGIEELSLKLRPAMLDDLGLLPTLLWHFERYTALTQVEVVFEHHGLGRRFQSEVETAAYRIVQEALTNVARHAQVSQAKVSVWVDQDRLNIQVIDQGSGFDAEITMAAGISSGLTGMQERAVLGGGRLLIESAPGKGAQLTAWLPLEYAGGAIPQ